MEMMVVMVVVGMGMVYGDSDSRDEDGIWRWW
jgi:hypothetical protein